MAPLRVLETRFERFARVEDGGDVRLLLRGFLGERRDAVVRSRRRLRRRRRLLRRLRRHLALRAHHRGDTARNGAIVVVTLKIL